VADRTEREEVIGRIEAVEARFREEEQRHRSAIAAMRYDLHTAVTQGEEAGISVASMAKALKISRSRLKRMMESLRQ
jgi:hypothetical protein